jgi:hypothetical protein
MIGSASHLFKVGASSYATDWVGEVGKLELRFKNVNFCPLAPILRDNCPGSLVQDIETLTVWYHKVYDNNIKGLLHAGMQFYISPSMYRRIRKQTLMRSSQN